MRKAISHAAKSASISKPKALDAMRGTASGKQVWNGKRRFDCYGLNGATVTDLLDAAAMASCALIWGFNRNGGLNLVVLLEGDKETFTVYDAEEFAIISAIIIQALQDYAIEKFSDIRQEFEAGEAATLG